ncbi:MAG TPA: hypothetical protein VIY86_04910, partial [Pirellulaceae bacterium]
RDDSRGNAPRRAAQIAILDGGGFDSTATNLGPRLQRFPALDLSVVEPMRTVSALQALSAELQRRLKDATHASTAPPVFVVIYNLARFRELRRTDDDYGLGSFSEGDGGSPAQQLIQLLREGPHARMHLIIWCDTYNNLTRWFERSTLRDLAYRVLFQMSATDSSNLMDSAAASQLGAHRAILHDDERGESERFRPYGLPELADLVGEAAE